jgi:uncharacterized protein (TIGR03000 family)
MSPAVPQFPETTMNYFVFRVQMICLPFLLQCAIGQAQEPTVTEPQTVTLRVLLPAGAENAQLRIGDRPTLQRGSTRVFITPPLEPGKDYEYALTALWAPNNYTKITRTRKVAIRVGPEIVADLRRPDNNHPDDIVVRYVPTPQLVVDAMLRLAAVGKDDVVYDLGCGDGRIVITAVKRFGAKRGVGIDIDPQRIRESRTNAARESVENKVEFRQGDVLKIQDLSDATAVMLYMGDDLNMQLRPILQRTLKPGTRIVSHRFTMGDWRPLKTETLFDERGEKYLIHFWKTGQ